MPQINNGKSPPWSEGNIVTAAGLNSMLESATLNPLAVTAQADLTTLTGDEYALIVNPATGLLNKTQLKLIMDVGLILTTPRIEGSQEGGLYGNLEIVSNEGLLIANTDTSHANTGIEIRSTGGNLYLNATDSGYSHGNGLITIQSGAQGIDFTVVSTGSANATARFAQKVIMNATSSLTLPRGTTAQRPSTPVAGDIRFNSTTAKTESYNGTTWDILQSDVDATSKTVDGYIKFSSGLIMQWGTSAPILPDNTATITFPIAFPTTCFNVTASVKTGTGAAVDVWAIVSTYSASTATIGVGANAGSVASVPMTWFAIGH